MSIIDIPIFHRVVVLIPQQWKLLKSVNFALHMWSLLVNIGDKTVIHSSNLLSLCVNKSINQKGQNVHLVKKGTKTVTSCKIGRSIMFTFTIEALNCYFVLSTVKKNTIFSNVHLL